jgi:tetratricopeptide (TPR) repeat protein/tRNA A-37 threonylcarbamoyl transferase component Bud32
VAQGAEQGDALRLVGGRFGRYVIVEQIGAGGMGVVYRAHDPELGRDVALKVVRVDRGRAGDATDATLRDGGTRARERLQREAQAMAKLSHPNVIAVFDVGVVGDDVFVAMELVVGKSLTAWLAAEPRTWREVLAAFRQAGRGLAAAHAAQLVHRDFKPDNVLVGDDGRVRVVDFGLARALDEAVGESGGDPGASDESLTATGTVLGTPAFMAPEQHLQRPVTPRTDQFSFCVALYQALVGHRPFVGDSYEELARAVVRGRVREPPARSVPGFVRRALRRGLAVEPAQRFADMEALLAALDRDPRRWLVPLAAALAVVALVTGVGLATRAPPPDVCAGGEERLGGLWDAGRREAVRRAFLATGAPFAEAAFARVDATLAAFGAHWVARRREACEATHVRGEQSGELLDRRMACLGSALGEARALVTLFASADRAVVERAALAAGGLPRLDACADVRQLANRAPRPTGAEPQAQADAIEARLAAARALLLAGRYREGLGVAAPLPVSAAALGFRPVQAQVLLTLGQLEWRGGDPRASAGTLHASARAATAGRDPRAAAEAEIELGQVLGAEIQDPAAAREALADATADLEGQGGDEDLAARLAAAEGQVDSGDAKLERAAAELERAQALYARTRGPDDLAVSSALNDLGGVYRRQGRYREAFACLERALAVRERTLGGLHPSIAGSLINLGNVHFTLGHHAEAQTYYERAQAIREAALGPDHPRVADGLVVMAQNLLELDRPAEALPLLERAFAIQEKALGPGHAELGHTLNVEGDTLRALHRSAEALPVFERAVEIRRAAFGPAHRYVAESIASQGDALMDLGRAQEAEARYREGLAIDEKARDADDPILAFELTGLGRAILAGRGPAAAVAPLERAVALRTAHPGDPAELAESRFALAQALWPSAPERARALAEDARAGYASAGTAKAAALAAVDGWLGAHRK